LNCVSHHVWNGMPSSTSDHGVETLTMSNKPLYKGGSLHDAILGAVGALSRVGVGHSHLTSQHKHVHGYDVMRNGTSKTCKTCK
jgi:hypothetical protein